jgi:hypothetical protein
LEERTSVAVTTSFGLRPVVVALQANESAGEDSHDSDDGEKYDLEDSSHMSKLRTKHRI